MTRPRNGWLTIVSVVVGAIVGILTIWTFLHTTIAGGATRESYQDLKIEATEKCINDHETRLRTVEKSLAEQRPIWRAVARKLNVELPRDTAGP